MEKKRIPDHVWRRRALAFRAINAEKASFRPCPRCNGEGFVDRSDWIVTETDGRRACFNCQGSGEARLKVRYATAYRLVPAVEQGDIDKILAEEAKAREDVYWPILEDVYERALNAAEKVAGC